MTRRAAIRATPEQVAPYLPNNYKVVSGYVAEHPDHCLIEGTDNAGWTLDEYVLPRLASGLIFGVEMKERA